MNKIRVLQIIEALGGGVYSYFTDLSHVMGKDDRVEIFIAYSNKRKEINPEDVAKDFHPNCTLILLDLEKEINPIKDYNGYLEIKKTIQEVKPAVVHLHSSKAGILGRLALKSFKNIKSFYTPHGYAFLREDISTSKKTFYRLLEHKFAQYSSTTTIACGDTELNFAQKFEKNPLLIRNGIRIDLISKSLERANDDFFTIGTLGRISYQKNPLMFNLYANASPEINYLWIGDGDLRDKLTSKNIEVTGWFTDRNEALPYLSKLDVYLQVSLWEGLPIAVIEAMAMGLPVIASDVIGNNDLVVHGKTGFLVKSKVEFLNAASILNDKKVREKMGRAGQQRIYEYFDCQKNFSHLVDIYVADC